MKKLILSAALLAAALPALQGCVTAVATGVTVGVLAAFDRRPLTTQTDDEAIEWKAASRLADKFGKENHINVTSFNRKVLISGETVSEDNKTRIGEIVRGVDNVQGIWNEIYVGPSSSLSGRSTDTYVTSKVKARFVDSGQFSANHVKVVTEAGVVFLLGIVNEREAQAAVQIARTTTGVRKVVNVMEVVSESETKRLDSSATSRSEAKPAPAAAPAPVEAPAAR
ncbi:MAG TPA: BON domain-containing protein [Rhodocyclaceae bacterium]|jgi:osmotically-inducible protein OsmY|nr:BON domain-containing protein [Rhodocyclaceae bacterium]HMW77033.1 BON domain-containing protein [Rhodocyclaceae bacterium]HNE42451.1 BON domain-containing protein [Rhodocyclaceae bacterium]HNL21632.1 BON domain-containing protein [Rhodocyclaceae bacterium]HNM22316.1 BON domain-containing protein [Rhodocyclaceae bacterium]